MRVGDIVQISWRPHIPNFWDGGIGIIRQVYATSYSVLLLNSPQVGWVETRGAFNAENLTVLGHIDVAQEGEER